MVKESESVGGLSERVACLDPLRSCLRNEEPIKLSTCVTLGFEDAKAVEKTDVRGATEKLGYNIMRAIQEETVVAPSTLVDNPSKPRTPRH